MTLENQVLAWDRYNNVPVYIKIYRCSLLYVSTCAENCKNFGQMCMFGHIHYIDGFRKAKLIQSNKKKKSYMNLHSSTYLYIH
jgi:hypothetical protein